VPIQESKSTSQAYNHQLNVCKHNIPAGFSSRRCGIFKIALDFRLFSKFIFPEILPGTAWGIP